MCSMVPTAFSPETSRTMSESLIDSSRYSRTAAIPTAISRPTSAARRVFSSGLGEMGEIGGTAGSAGKLIVFNGNTKNAGLGGRTALALKTWHHVVLVRDGHKVTVYLDGNPEPEIAGELESTLPGKSDEWFLGGRSDNFANFEGKLDEVALYQRSLTSGEIAAHYRTSGLPPRPPTPAAPPQ